MYVDCIGDGRPLSYYIGKVALKYISHYYVVNLGFKEIMVNVVTPCMCLKEDFYLNNEELIDSYEEIIPLGRIGSLEDFTKLVIFLFIPEPSFISCQNLYVDAVLSQVWTDTVARKPKPISSESVYHALT